MRGSLLVRVVTLMGLAHFLTAEGSSLIRERLRRQGRGGYEESPRGPPQVPALYSAPRERTSPYPDLDTTTELSEEAGSSLGPNEVGVSEEYALGAATVSPAETTGPSADDSSSSEENSESLEEARRKSVPTTTYRSAGYAYEPGPKAKGSVASNEIPQSYFRRPSDQQQVENSEYPLQTPSSGQVGRSSESLVSGYSSRPQAQEPNFEQIAALQLPTRSQYEERRQSGAQTQGGYAYTQGQPQQFPQQQQQSQPQEFQQQQQQAQLQQFQPQQEAQPQQFQQQQQQTQPQQFQQQQQHAQPQQFQQQKQQAQPQQFQQQQQAQPQRYQQVQPVQPEGYKQQPETQGRQNYGAPRAFSNTNFEVLGREGNADAGAEDMSLDGLNENIVDADLLQRVQEIIDEHEKQQKANQVQDSNTYSGRPNESEEGSNHVEGTGSNHEGLRNENYANPEERTNNRAFGSPSPSGYTSQQPQSPARQTTNAHSAGSEDQQTQQSAGVLPNRGPKTLSGNPNVEFQPAILTGHFVESMPEGQVRKAKSREQANDGQGYAQQQQRSQSQYQVPEQSPRFQAQYQASEQSQRSQFQYPAPEQSQRSQGGYQAPEQLQRSQTQHQAPEHSQRSQGQYQAPEQSQRSQGQYQALEQSQRSQGQYQAPEQSQRSQGQYQAPEQSQRSQAQYQAPEQSQRSQGQYQAPEQSERSQAQYKATQLSELSQGQYKAPEQSERSQAQYKAPQQSARSRAEYQAPEQSDRFHAQYQAPEQSQRSQAQYQAPEQSERARGLYLPPAQEQPQYQQLAPEQPQYPTPQQPQYQAPQQPQYEAPQEPKYETSQHAYAQQVPEQVQPQGPEPVRFPQQPIAYQDQQLQPQYTSGYQQDQPQAAYESQAQIPTTQLNERFMTQPYQQPEGPAVNKAGYTTYYLTPEQARSSFLLHQKPDQPAEEPNSAIETNQVTEPRFEGQEQPEFGRNAQYTRSELNSFPPQRGYPVQSRAYLPPASEYRRELDSANPNSNVIMRTIVIHESPTQGYGGQGLSNRALVTAEELRGGSQPQPGPPAQYQYGVPEERDSNGITGTDQQELAQQQYQFLSASAQLTVADNSAQAYNGQEDLSSPRPIYGVPQGPREGVSTPRPLYGLPQGPGSEEVSTPRPIYGVPQGPGAEGVSTPRPIYGIPLAPPLGPESLKEEEPASDAVVIEARQQPNNYLPPREEESSGQFGGAEPSPQFQAEGSGRAAVSVRGWDPNLFTIYRLPHSEQQSVGYPVGVSPPLVSNMVALPAFDYASAGEDLTTSYGHNVLIRRSLRRQFSPRSQGFFSRSS